MILAGAGYTSTEAAAAIGTTRSSLATRSCRKKEFIFPLGRKRYKLPPEEFAKVVKEAKDLIEREAPRLGEPKRQVFAGNVANPRQPNVARKNIIVEAPLTKDEIKAVLKDEGTDEFSVAFSDMSAKQCRWIVGKNEHDEHMVCGRPQTSGSSYCQSHQQASVSAKQPKILTPNLVYAWDQSTKLVEPTKKMASSLLRKS